MGDLSVVEICAGAGGQSLGLHRAGFSHQLAVELDATAAHTLQMNLERLEGTEVDVRVGDVADGDLWDAREFKGVDLFAGGVPCPPFSIAGKQLGSMDERDLFAWAVEQVGIMRPRAVLLENVRGLSTPRFSGYRQAVADRFAEFGYWSEWRLLHANNFGVPQLRPRFVLVAMAEEDARHFVWPTEEPTAHTVGTELFELMSENGWRYAAKWAEKANRIAPTIVGGSKKHGGADLGPTRAKRAWAELFVDGKGVADAPPARRAPSFRTRMPRLTNEMVARLQGWGRPGYEWEFAGRKTSTYRQIGNAFPPPVAEAVGASIVAALHRTRQPNGHIESRVHDEVYQVLQQAQAPLTVEAIVALLGKGADANRVWTRLQALSEDFVLDELVTATGTAYGLGGFKAFLGQDHHVRHDYFKDGRRRARVS